MHSEHAGCQWFEQVWNRRDRAAMARLATPDVHAHGADGITRDLAGFAAFYDLMTAALPDLRIDVVNCVHGADRVAVHWHATGTHTGDAASLSPTGRRIEVSGLSLMRFEQDKIAEAWDSYDIVGLMSQLGAAAPA